MPSNMRALRGFLFLDGVEVAYEPLKECFYHSFPRYRMKACVVYVPYNMDISRVLIFLLMIA